VEGRGASRQLSFELELEFVFGFEPNTRKEAPSMEDTSHGVTPPVVASSKNESDTRPDPYASSEMHANIYPKKGDGV
jgi:hypothetical protein